MWRPTLLLAAALAVPAQALHFFIDGAVEKCFFEELPKDTLVVGPSYLGWALDIEGQTRRYQNTGTDKTQATTTPKYGTMRPRASNRTPTPASL
jgi:hypothetical protein